MAGLLLAAPAPAGPITPLQQAVIAHDESAVIAALRAGEPSAMPDGTPLLIEASRRSLAGVVKHLIDSGADVSVVAPDGNNALHVASRAHADTVIPLLLATGRFEVNAPDARGYPPLWYAVTDGPEAVERLLRAGADPNRPTSDGRQVTPLCRAAERGFAKSLPALIAGGAKVKGGDGFEAVRSASFHETDGHLEAIRILGRAGAPMHADKASDDPLMRAIGDKKYRTMEALLESGADVNRTFENDTTPVIRAVSFSNAPKALQILLKHKPHLDHFARFPVSRKGVTVLGAGTGASESNEPAFITRTALMLAASEGKLEMVRLLLAAGADPLLKNNLGETARDLAKRGGHAEVVRLLAKAADVRRE